ncbi:unnamed protein product, partial [Polarella glacialis]
CKDLFTPREGEKVYTNSTGAMASKSTVTPLNDFNSKTGERQHSAAQLAESRQDKEADKMLLLSPLSTCSTAPPLSPSESSLYCKSGMQNGSTSFSYQEDSDDEDILFGKPLWSYTGPSLEELLKNEGLCQK